MIRKICTYSGLAMAFLGLAMLGTALFSTRYSISAEEMKAIIADENHYALLQHPLSAIVDVEYTSAHSLIADFNSLFNEVNEGLKEKGDWDHVIYTDYTLPVVLAATRGPVRAHPWLWMFLCFLLPALGGLMFIIPTYGLGLPGIQNDGIFRNPLTSRKWAGYLIAVALIAFYIFLYWFPAYIAPWIMTLDGLSHALNGGAASQWFLYGFLYCVAMLVMGVRMLLKYRHNAYQVLRTSSVLFFQVTFAFLIPQLLAFLNLPAPDLKNMWPLDYSFFFDYRLDEMISKGSIGLWMLGWGIALFIIGVPVLTYLFGKRWYCSWVCGCGGLAETLGDPFRQLSNKSLRVWKLERVLIHSVLLFSVLMTLSVLYTYISGNSVIVGINSYDLRSWYGFLIGSVFAGVIGTGFYPILGNRAWCRFGCPLAAYLGMVQRFKSRFRITTNGGQCISCGNCSTYCEMGIDVRSYAQKGQNIVRASCVGCGICAAVCPRGVLRLENRTPKGRISDKPILTGNDSFTTNNTNHPGDSAA